MSHSRECRSRLCHSRLCRSRLCSSRLCRSRSRWCTDLLHVARSKSKAKKKAKVYRYAGNTACTYTLPLSSSFPPPFHILPHPSSYMPLLHPTTATTSTQLLLIPPFLGSPHFPLLPSVPRSLFALLSSSYCSSNLKIFRISDFELFYFAPSGPASHYKICSGLQVLKWLCI